MKNMHVVTVGVHGQVPESLYLMEWKDRPLWHYIDGEVLKDDAKGAVETQLRRVQRNSENPDAKDYGFAKCVNLEEVSKGWVAHVLYVAVIPDCVHAAQDRAQAVKEFRALRDWMNKIDPNELIG